MYRIVIADDEPLIIRGLRKMMDWEGMNTEIVGDALDGDQLMELLEQAKPDIVISDISMPGKSGLDVIREVKERELNTKVIFMSGFQEFDYAKAAVTYGAVDYLLKPVTVEELEKAIGRAKEMLKQERPESLWEKEKQTVESDFRKLRQLSRQKKREDIRIPDGIGGDSQYFAGVCFALTGDTLQQIKGSNRFELMRFAIFKGIDEYLTENKIGFVARREENSSSIVLVLSCRDKVEELERIVGQIREAIRKKYGVSLVAGIGEITEDAGKLEFIYKTAKFSAGMYYFLQQETIFYKDIDRKFTCSFDEYEEICRELIQKILVRDEQWRGTFADCLKMIRNLHYGSCYAVENRCILLAMDVYQRLLEYKVIDGENRESFERQAEELRGQNNYGELKHKFTRFMERFVDEYVFQRGRQENDAIFKVKEYIRKHFAEDITLEQMAQLVYMNPYYFSTFFKKETGQNFKAYLLQVRMEKALRYLMETDMKTYELARQVGYRDVRTFTDKFKEFYGSSPSKYKKHSKK